VGIKGNKIFNLIFKKSVNFYVMLNVLDKAQGYGLYQNKGSQETIV